ncbi:MAG: hypothetical protein WBF16_09470 [Candidatus Deferrimicrobiaceae bacterium]|jgi:fructose-bisphosphate aldolase class II
MNGTPLRKFLPENVASKVPQENPACPVNGRDVFRALSPHNVIVMACNIRIPSVIPGIMRAAAELDALVAFELAKSEGNLDGGYTGMTPEIFVSTILAYAGGIEDAAYREALSLLRAFRAEGTGQIVSDYLIARV